MNSRDERCPSTADVLLAADGELSPEVCDRIAAHLARCLHCREMQADDDSLIRTYAAAAEATLPERSSADRETRFLARLHAQRQQVALPHLWAVRHALIAASVFILLVVGMTLSRETVQADALLEAAVREQSAAPDLVQRIGIRLTPETSPTTVFTAQPVPWVGELVGGTLVRSEGIEEGAPAALVQILDAHHLDLRRPFDARRLRAWHAGLRGQHEEVRRVGDQWIVHTRPVGGAIRALEVTLQHNSHHIIRVILVVDHVGRVEIEELSQSVRRASDAAPSMPLASPPVAAVRPPSATGPADRPPLLQLAESALVRWRDRRFGSTPERETFLPALHANVQRVSAHLHALQDLARHYPTTRALSSVEATALQGRVDAHLAVVRAAVEALAEQRRTLFGSVSRCTTDQAPSIAGWRRDSAIGLDQITHLEQHLRVLLQHEDLPVNADADVGGAIELLWQRFLCPTGSR